MESLYWLQALVAGDLDPGQSGGSFVDLGFQLYHHLWLFFYVGLERFHELVLSVDYVVWCRCLLLCGAWLIQSCGCWCLWSLGNVFWSGFICFTLGALFVGVNADLGTTISVLLLLSLMVEGLVLGRLLELSIHLINGRSLIIKVFLHLGELLLQLHNLLLPITRKFLFSWAFSRWLHIQNLAFGLLIWILNTLNQNLSHLQLRFLRLYGGIQIRHNPVHRFIFNKVLIWP